MSSFSPDAGEHSGVRVELARQLTADCPQDLGQEIAITGSVARGVADHFSDIELCFLVDELAPVETYHRWLLSAGAEVELEEASAYWGGITTKSWFNGVFVEALWQTRQMFNAHLQPVVAVEILDHWDLVGAWRIAHAVPLRDGPVLADWQHRLSVYPATLGERLIRQATLARAEPHWWPLSTVNIWPLVQRDARLALATKLIREVERVLRVVFAVNRQWEPDWKWLAPEQRRLTNAPTDFVERVNGIFSAVDAAESVSICLNLILDALELVPPSIDVMQQKRQVHAALYPERLLKR
jgi:predicted nucleotidyltransferase